MDAISPTLAFAVILFGMSDNPRDTASEAAASNGCPALTVTGDPMQPEAPQSWREAFWRVANDTNALPDIIDPRWDDVELPAAASPEPSAGDVASAGLMTGTDPIARKAAPAAESGPVTEPDEDPCLP